MKKILQNVSNKKRDVRLRRAYSPFFIVLFFLFSFFCVHSAYANNLSIDQVSLEDRNTTSKTINVKFRLATWENTWKDEINNDAVWIFVKYSTTASPVWNHASITSAATTPNGASITVASDYKGVFIQNANYGTGTPTFVGGTNYIELVWSYGLDGVADADVINASNSKVRVFGIEMVYIPAGGFYAGDTSSTAAFKQGSSDTKPWFIPNENAIHCTNVTSGGYYYVTGGNTGEDATGTDFWIPQDFPKGYKAIYMMKYEISEQQWIDFFNTLASGQLAARDITSGTDSGKGVDTVSYRNSVAYVSLPATTTYGARACNYLGWKDLCAYAAWSGLRPMTELEFEKAARGPLAAVSGEKPWGTTGITNCAAAGISGTEDGTEYCTTASANCTYNNINFTSGSGGYGPTRVGIYATSTTATARASAGAGFYGNLDLSGNVSERVVTVGNSTGRAFLGSHGDGVLSSAGNATNPDWPGYSNGEVLGSTGSGSRGGTWLALAASGEMTTSSRTSAANPVTSRSYTSGGRCVRTAP